MLSLEQHTTSCLPDGIRGLIAELYNSLLREDAEPAAWVVGGATAVVLLGVR